MPRKNNTSNQETKKQEMSFEELCSFEILRAREVEYNGRKSVLADVKLNGVCVYGVRAVTYTDKRDNKEKDFIGWPERAVKDKNGETKYYKVAYMALSGEDQQKVCDAIYQKLDG
jgi:hypothetical protein